MGILNSIKKSTKIRKISKVFGKPFEASDILNQIIEKDNSWDLAENELYDLCESDTNLKIVMQKYNANRNTLSKMFNFLISNGAGQWVKGHYVAVSALTFAGTLDYLLKNRDRLNGSNEERMKICYRLVTYFENDEIGFITD